MEKSQEIEALKDIRMMMNRSVRFLSLSGLSGVSAGVYALIAGALAYRRLNTSIYTTSYSIQDVNYFIMLALFTLIITLITAFIFTYNKSKRQNIKLWGASSKLALINMSIPLVIGGVFCLALKHHGFIGFLVPASLIFYGLSLLSVSKHTMEFIKTLGFLQILLGLINAFYIGYGILFWMLGFGVLHIIYGVYMYFRFDRV